MAQDSAVHRSPGEAEEQRPRVAALYSEVNARPRRFQWFQFKNVSICFNDLRQFDPSLSVAFYGFWIFSAPLFHGPSPYIIHHHPTDTPRLYVPQVISSR